MRSLKVTIWNYVAYVDNDRNILQRRRLCYGILCPRQIMRLLHAVRLLTSPMSLWLPEVRTTKSNANSASA